MKNICDQIYIFDQRDQTTQRRWTDQTDQTYERDRSSIWLERSTRLVRSKWLTDQSERLMKEIINMTRTINESRMHKVVRLMKVIRLLKEIYDQH